MAYIDLERDATVAAAELPAAVASALKLHARWLGHEPGGVRADLCQRRLPGIDLRGADLTGAALRDIDLSNADLRGAKLIRADLQFAVLRGADLRDADLESANLDMATLADANLHDAWLRNATLVGTNLDGINMSWYDHALMGERLMRAAGDDLELRMLAAYIGRMTNYCWDDYRELPHRHRMWLIRQAQSWRQPDDVDPPKILEWPT